MENKMKPNPFLAPVEDLSSDSFSFYDYAKRCGECIISLCLLFILSPVFLIVSILIRITSQGPAFYSQQRVGINGQLFTIWKFRTMETNCPPVDLPSKTWTEGVADDFVYKSSPSTSVTKIGKWLRKTSIDELPQLINILKGEMSFVGPRPETPNIASYYNEEQKKRLSVKPGITGYAQVSGRSNMTHGMKMHYDLQYIEHACFLFDIKIICRTCIQVIKTDGAF